MNYFEELADKKVLITGGGAGIGKELALAFARLGSQVIITGRNEQQLAQTALELQTFSPGSSFVVADLTSVAAIRQLMETAINSLGRLDILVNNAGINIAKPAMEVTEADWDKVLDTNLKAVFFCCQQAAVYMLPRRSGKIINIASQMAFVGFRDRAAYCSSKGGLVQLTKALAIEWAPYQLNVNAVAPTFIETALTATMFADADFAREVLGRIPLGRLAKANDLTGAVLYLSSGLSDMVTGETIKVDGGWTAI